MPGADFGGLRVLSLESRRAVEVGKLIRTYGGDPLTAPAMREIPLESNQPIIDFTEALMRGAFDSGHLHHRGRGPRACQKRLGAL